MQILIKLRYEEILPIKQAVLSENQALYNREGAESASVFVTKSLNLL